MRKISSRCIALAALEEWRAGRKFADAILHFRKAWQLAIDQQTPKDSKPAKNDAQKDDEKDKQDEADGGDQEDRKD